MNKVFLDKIERLRAASARLGLVAALYRLRGSMSVIPSLKKVCWNRHLIQNSIFDLNE